MQMSTWSAKCGIISAVIMGAFLARTEMVSEDTARAAAKGFLSKSSVAKTILAGRSVDSIEARESLWIIRLAPSGYIELAGSTKCAPILSFSEYDFSEPEVGSPFAAKLTSDSMMVEKKEADESLVDNSDWAKYTSSTSTKRLLLAGAKPTGTDGTGYSSFVAPLLGATWHQTAPYNDLSPYNYYCGCMATAAGQELRYWRWPYRFEKFRQTTHGVRDAQNNYYDFVLRPNGLVPFDWDQVKTNYTYESNASTPWATNKVATYNAAFLSLWMQSLTGMGYKPGGSGGTKQLASTAEDYWYEKGRVYTYWDDGYTNLWNAVKADLDWGSPIQINTAAHQMVIDGYAVENYGEEDEVDWINLNLGYGGSVYWTDLKAAVTTGTYSGVLAAFQTGYRPQKIVQFEPLPKVCSNEVTLAWHLPPCYTNRISGFLLQTAKDGTTVGGGVISSTGDTTTRYTYTATGLAAGGEYTFTVTPIMNEGEGTGRANSVTTTIGTPQPAPEILSVSSVACGIELVQQGIFVECARGITNQIKVTCSESTTSLTNYSSHLTILPDNKISVTKNGNVFTVNVDACDMAQRWNVEGEMIILTMVASNADGTETCKNLMLRFNSMRNVLGGTFDVVASGDTQSPVWFANGTTTTIDVKGQSITFGANAFHGTGTVKFMDSVGGGSVAFDGLAHFTGTLVLPASNLVTLPSDMSGFSGTISLASSTTYTYAFTTDIPATATINIPAYTQMSLGNNAVIDAKITGTGFILIYSGSSSLGNLSNFSGTISNYGATLTINAGDENAAKIENDDGTLCLVLNEAQVAYGYTASIYRNWANVVFKDTAGKILKTWTTDDKTFSFAATANTWTPDSSTNAGTFSDSTRWSFGRVPLAGEYALVDATYLYGASTLTLNLSSDLHLAYIKVVGEGGIANAVINATTGTATLTADTFENTVSTTLNTDKIQLATVIPRASLKIANGIVVDCQIDSSIATNLKNPSGLSALTSSDYWIGTVVFENRTVDVKPGEYGNVNSKLLFTGATGRLDCPEDIESEVVLEDLGDSPAFHWNGGYGDRTPVLNKLSGDGTLKTSNAIAETVVVKDVSEFTGSLNLASKTIAIADEKPSSNTGSGGLLHICKPVTNAVGKTWMANGGLYLGAGGTLVVNGSFATGSGVVVYGAGAGLTIEDGACVKVNAAMSGDYAPTLNFKAGTYQITANVTETKTVNFCAATGKCTTLDANGYKMTLGPNFFSGSGDVYLTSSASGGAFVLQGVSSAFTGTIYADISAGVTVSGDLSQSSGKISFSDISLSVPSTSLGNVDVGSGGTLVVTVSKSDRIKGLVIASVTLVNGGALVLQDTDGKTLATFAAADAVDGKYTLEPDENITPTCVLDYEFNGNVDSIGTDTTALSFWNSSAQYYNNSALYMCRKPYIGPTFAMPDDEWSAVMRCTLPAANSEKRTMMLMFGKNGGNVFGLVAGTIANTVALADGNGIIGDEVEVENATANYHVYTIVKTSNRVRLYVDGELKANELATISVAKEFQIGSIKNGNSTSYAACDDTNALIDFLRFYDFAANKSFITEQLDALSPTPTAVWTSGEFGDSATNHGGYAIYTMLAGSINSNGNIEIGENTSLGAWINVASVTNCTKASVLVKYKVPEGGAPAANTAIAGVLDTDSNKMGALSTTSGGIGFTGFHQSSSATSLTSSGFDFENAPALSSTDGGEGYMLFAFQSDTGSTTVTGTALYLGESIDSMTGGNRAGLQWRGKSINTLAIGGPAASTSVSPISWTGLEIESVALFIDQWLTAADVLYYKFPDEIPVPVLTVLPESGSTVEVGDEITMSCDDDTATIWYKKNGEEDYTKYVGPVAFTAVGEDVFYVQLRNEDDEVVVEDQQFTYTVAAKPSLPLESPLPVTFWTSRHFQDDASEHAGYSITMNDGNTINEEGNIVIGNAATLGATIDIHAVTNCPKISVLVGFNYDGTTAPAANAIIAGACGINTNNNVETQPFGAICTNETGTALTGYWLNNTTIKSSDFPFGSASVPNGSGYMIFSYYSAEDAESKFGTKCYIGDAIGSLTGAQADGLQFRKQEISRVSVGGPVSNHGLAWSGLEINLIAIYPNEWISPSNVTYAITNDEDTPAGYATESSAVITNLEKNVTLPSYIQTWDVKYGASSLTAAFKLDEDRKLVLDSTAQVGGVSVTPQLDETEGVPFDMSDDENASLSIKTIPGLWYDVFYGDMLSNDGVGGTTGSTGPEQATGSSKSLVAPKSGSKRFYRVRVAPRMSDLK